MTTKPTLQFEPDCTICAGTGKISGQPCVCTLGSQVHPGMAKPSIPAEPLADGLTYDAAAVLAEVRSARANWPAFNSAHEGFAVLLEEVDELKAHVWTNQRKRDLDAMRKEAMQVAAMALRFMGECCSEATGRK